jgi:short chain dehydrogenase
MRSPNLKDSSSNHSRSTQTSSQKIALVTGANKGIGFEVARQLAAVNCAVVFGARNKVPGEHAAARLNAEGLDVSYLALDLDDHATIAAAARTIATQFDCLDILVNSAGIVDPHDGRSLPAASARPHKTATPKYAYAAAKFLGYSAPRPPSICSRCKRLRTLRHTHQSQFRRPRLHLHRSQRSSRHADHP